jgi:hypothetical protein
VVSTIDEDPYLTFTFFEADPAHLDPRYETKVELPVWSV